MSLDISITETQYELLRRHFDVNGRITTRDPITLVCTEYDIPFRHFVQDAGIVKRRPRNKMLITSPSYDPRSPALGFCESLTALIKDDYQLYLSLFKLSHDIESLVEPYIESCEETKLLVLEKSFSESVRTHIHIPSDISTECVTFLINLAKKGNSKFTIYETVERYGIEYQRGFGGIEELQQRCDAGKRKDYIIPGDSITAVVFDSAIQPHEFIIEDGLWLCIAFDQAIFKKSIETLPGVNVMHIDKI